MIKVKPITPERLAKLPAWVIEHIADLERARESAVHVLKGFTNAQAKSDFFVDEYASDKVTGGPSTYRRYIQTTQMVVEAHGVRLRISTKYGSTNDNSITLQWEDVNRRADEIAAVPFSFQMIRLIAKDKMR